MRISARLASISIFRPPLYVYLDPSGFPGRPSLHTIMRAKQKLALRRSIPKLATHKRSRPTGPASSFICCYAPATRQANATATTAGASTGRKLVTSPQAPPQVASSPSVRRRYCSAWACSIILHTVSCSCARFSPLGIHCMVTTGTGSWNLASSRAAYTCLGPSGAQP